MSGEEAAHLLFFIFKEMKRLGFGIPLEKETGPFYRTPGNEIYDLIFKTEHTLQHRNEFVRAWDELCREY